MEKSKRNDNLILPTFVIAGAGKAGTSTLWHYLNQHPQILMSSKKEPSFFNSHWNAGPAYYQQFFRCYANHKAVGEASVSYFADPDVPPRMQALIPQIKLVFSLRDPVQRAVSHYWWRVTRFNESRDLDEILDGGISEYVVDRSRYHTHLCRFLEYFPRQHVHVVIIEEFEPQFESQMASLWSFLDVDPSVTFGYEGRRNSAHSRRSRALSNLLSPRRPAIVTKIAARVPTSLRPAIGKVTRGLRAANNRSFVPPPLRPDQADRLRTLLAPEVRSLELLLERRFPWTL